MWSIAKCRWWSSWCRCCRSWWRTSLWVPGFKHSVQPAQMLLESLKSWKRESTKAFTHFFQHDCFIFVDPFTCLLIWSSVVYIAWKDWPGLSFEINAETSNPTNYSFRRGRRGERGRERENESQKTLSSGKCSYNVRICCCCFLIIFWNCSPRLRVERRNCMQLSSHDLRLTHALVNLRHSN